jgi:hypothetical protein
MTRPRSHTEPKRLTTIRLSEKQIVRLTQLHLITKGYRANKLSELVYNAISLALKRLGGEEIAR